MAYDEDLAQAFRDAAAGKATLTEKRMMGGVCFLVSGNMLGGADRTKDGQRRFMFRVGKEREAEALARPGALPVEFGKGRMGGLVFVDSEACDEEALAAWIDLALEFVGKLPPK